jgi:outer membrane protein assembly factor BamA
VIKITPFLLAALFMIISFAGFAQQDEEKDAEELEKTIKEDKVKTGWNFGALPVISYDSDLGLQLGALTNLYHYGDGSRYPAYDHSLYLEASWFLKGSGIFRFYYDSDRLIKGIRTSLDVSYIPDQTFKFFGFNGYEAVYNQNWENHSATNYKTRVFYRLKRTFFRMKMDFQGKIINDKFLWLAGADYYNITTSSVDIGHLNSGKDPEDLLPDTIDGLYENYVKWGIIPQSEKDGGMFTAIKLGLVYDSRDNEPNPQRGIWTEIILASAPKVFSNMDQGFMKLAITHRQYFTLVKDRLNFVYRLGAQFNIAGHTPWYAQGIMYYSKMAGAYNEGLGGAKTLRGIQRNRVIGDGIAFGNFELRWKFWKFYLMKQNFYMAISGFFDSGRVIQFIEVEDIVNKGNIVYPDGDTRDDYFDFEGGEGFHNSAGAGLHIAMNQNFILAIDYGMALNEQDGKSGFYIGLNFLF